MVAFRNFQLIITDVLIVSLLAMSQDKQLLCWVLQWLLHEVPRYNWLIEYSIVIQANPSLCFQFVTKTFSGDNDLSVQIFLQQSCQVRAPNISKGQHSQAVVVCTAVPGRVPLTSFEIDLPRTTSSGSVSKCIASPQSSGYNWKPRYALELDKILSTLLWYGGHVLSHNHITQVLLAALYNHGILAITDPRLQMQFQEVIAAPTPVSHCLPYPWCWPHEHIPYPGSCPSYSLRVNLPIHCGNVLNISSYPPGSSSEPCFLTSCITRLQMKIIFYFVQNKKSKKEVVYWGHTHFPDIIFICIFLIRHYSDLQICVLCKCLPFIP